MKEIWNDRGRILGLPIRATSYKIKGDSLYIRKGFFSINEAEVKLFRVQDISLRIGLLDRAFNQGSITIYSTDMNEKVLTIKNIENPENVRDMISKIVTEAKRENNIRGIETLDVCSEHLHNHISNDYI